MVGQTSYLYIASKNSPFDKLNISRLIGSTLNQLKEPCSGAISFNLASMKDALSCNTLRLFCWFTILFFCIDNLQFFISFADTVYGRSCCANASFNLLFNSCEYLYSSLTSSIRLMIPIPPSLHRNASRIFSSSDIWVHIISSWWLSWLVTKRCWCFWWFLWRIKIYIYIRMWKPSKLLADVFLQSLITLLFPRTI